jgi:hypothetical protein
VAVLHEAPKRRVLQSWKEIAAHLGVTVRSVQRWEEAGLPVHRQGSGSKARVFAYTDELQEWLVAGGAIATQPAEIASLEDSRRRWLWYGSAVCALLALVVGLLVLRQTGILPGARVPHSWTMEGTRLKIFDAHDRLCWEKRFSPFASYYEQFVKDRVLIADIDNDGRIEVLVNMVPENLAETGGSLLCFEQSGKLRWEYHYGGTKTFGTRTFEPSYVGRFLRVVTVNGRPRILTIANHYLWYPAQAALLDPITGRLIEEYWHPGSIYYYAIRDLDHDGQQELLLGALNNPGEGLGHAALVALRIPFSAGPRKVSVPNPPPGGGELAYVLFPLPDVAKVMGILPIMARFNIDAQQRIVIETPLPENGGLVYYLDRNFRVLEYHFSDNFSPLHNRFFRQGLLDHPLTDRETAALGQVATFATAPDGNSPAVQQFWKF